MRSLSSLVRGTGTSDPLARAVAAILDSGLIVAVRDGGGRFVQTSPPFGQTLGVTTDIRGRDRVEGQRFFDADGREIAAREHPAFIARATGEPQRNRLVGYRTRDGDEAWLQISFVPLERSAEGWSVLSIGADVTALHRRAQELEAALEARDRLLAFAAQAAVESMSPAEVAAAIAPVLARALPTANVFFGLVSPEGLAIEQILQRFPNEFDGRRVRLSAEAASRGASARTHVNLDVKDTDIYGDRVMAEWRQAFGSIAVVPMYDADRAWIGSLLALEPARNGIRPDQVRLLESAAAIAARSMDRPRAARVA